MEIRLIRDPVAFETIRAFAREQFDGMTKATVDVAREILAVGGELHADEEALLLEDGSSQGDLWGINLYPDKPDGDWIEFDSMINVRPSQNNRSRGVEDAGLRARIARIVERLTGREAGSAGREGA